MHAPSTGTSGRESCCVKGGDAEWASLTQRFGFSMLFVRKCRTWIINTVQIKLGANSKITFQNRKADSSWKDKTIIAFLLFSCYKILFSPTKTSRFWILWWNHKIKMKEDTPMKSKCFQSNLRRNKNTNMFKPTSFLISLIVNICTHVFILLQGKGKIILRFKDYSFSSFTYSLSIFVCIGKIYKALRMVWGLLRQCVPFSLEVRLNKAESYHKELS